MRYKRVQEHYEEVRDPPASQIIRQVILAHQLVSRPTRKPETSLFRGAIGNAGQSCSTTVCTTSG